MTLKDGQTVHPVGCQCDFCKAGWTSELGNMDPIQNNCKYGYVLPDRCIYIANKGCPCGAYPPLIWDGEKYVNSPKER